MTALTIQCMRLYTGCFTGRTSTTNFAYVTATNAFVMCDTSTRPLHMPLSSGVHPYILNELIYHVGKTCPVNYMIQCTYMCEYCRNPTAVRSLRECRLGILHASPPKRIKASIDSLGLHRSVAKAALSLLFRSILSVF